MLRTEKEIKELDLKAEEINRKPVLVAGHTPIFSSRVQSFIDT